MSGTSKALLIPDTHAPYHDEKAFSLVLRVARQVRFDHVYILGDFCDMLEVSFHEKSPGNRPGFAAEIASCNELLDRIDALRIKRRHFIAGNHEFRLDRYMANRAPELAGLPGHSVPELLRLKERGWRYTPYRQHTKLGKLYLTHEEGNAGPLAALKARDTFQGNVVIGHCHSMMVAYQGNARGDSHVGASFGWLGDVSRIDYMHRVKANRWQTGFGVACIEPSGNVHLQAVPIINGRCCVFGKVYS